MNKIVSIHYLRGIAALLVVAYHNKTSGYEASGNQDIFEYLFKGGAFGVDLFFIISGFIIAYSTKENTENNLLNFTLKRLF
ncbi:acyltransferase family protein [Type-E symbiont of Plautia stali]|uniref:acyltransferase family protein n=1 Tax=Type-E symbiont of Plautia stali TaxID=1560357 RepID=UPI00073E2754